VGVLFFVFFLYGDLDFVFSGRQERIILGGKYTIYHFFNDVKYKKWNAINFLYEFSSTFVQQKICRLVDFFVEILSIRPSNHY
jgi:hypothetical protein